MHSIQFISPLKHLRHALMPQFNQQTASPVSMAKPQYLQAAQEVAMPTNCTHLEVARSNHAHGQDHAPGRKHAPGVSLGFPAAQARGHGTSAAGLGEYDLQGQR